MTLFRLIATAAIVTLVAAIVIDIRRGGKTWGGAWKFFRDQTGTALHLWRTRRERAHGSTFDNLRRMAYGLSAGFLLLLALTGFLPIILFGEHLSGPLLIIHVTVAPLFAISLSALALLWAHRLRFDEDDWHIVLNPSLRRVATVMRWIGLALKIGFWLVLLLSLPLMGSIILGLFPLFGTDGQGALIRVHGYSALLILVVSLVVIHLTIAYIENTFEQPSKESSQ